MSQSSLFGLLNVFKPAGWTSRDVVNRVAKLVRPAKAGHAGTLDPLATGVLVVCVGPATRLINCVQEHLKEYVGTFELGCTSDTDDNTGKVTQLVVATPPLREQIQAFLPEFTGEIEQIPPQYSAIHVGGERAYDLARAGQTVELAPRKVLITRLEIEDYTWPKLVLRMECGSGTYVRSVGRDLGTRLGCGGVMTDLVRTRIGPFHTNEAVPVEKLTTSNLREHLLSATTATAHWPQHQCTPVDLWEIAHGRGIIIHNTLPEPVGKSVALLTPDLQLAGLGVFQPGNRIAPTQVFVQREELTGPHKQA